MVSCQELFPLKWSKHSLNSVTPMTQHWWMHFPLCQWGWRQGVALPQHCTLPAHEVAILPLSLLPLPWPSPLQLPLPSPLLLPTTLPLPLLSPNAVVIAVGHCRCGCRQPSMPPSLLHCRQPLPLPLLLPLPLAIAVSITVGHWSYHRHRPSPLPLPLVKSCCLGTVRIVFDQLKQRMLTYFILFGHWVAHWSKPDDWIGVEWQWPTPALGGERQALSGVAGSRGAAGGQQGGNIDWPCEVLFCCVVGVSAIVKWRLWWCVGCGRRHCWWDSDWTYVRRKRD